MKSALLGFLAVFVIAGCGKDDLGQQISITPEQSRQKIDSEIKKVEDNPNMPPQAKAAAIAALKRSAEMGKGQTTAPPGAK